MCFRNVEKKDWIKTSFWAPENTPDNQTSAAPGESQNKDDAGAIPSKKLYCPIHQKGENSDKHQIRIKELISLKFDSEEKTRDTASGKVAEERYICWVC